MSVPDQVCFRCDLPAWLRTLKARDRKIAMLLAQGHSATAIVNRFGITPGRVSQLRRELRDSWRRFQGEPIGAAA